MAISINAKSPIQGTTGTIYTNTDNPTLELFLDDTSNVNLDYSIVRKEGSRYKVIFKGKGIGFNNGVNYQYRFDFEKFIRYDKIETTVTHVDSYYAYVLGNNDCELILCLGDIFTSSASMLETLSNGEVYLKVAYTPVDLIATKFYYAFKDRIDGTGYYKPSEVIPSTWYPITLYSGQLNFSIIATNGSVIKGDGITVPAGYSYIVAFLKLPASFRSIQFAYNTVNLPEIYVTNKCINPIYFMGKDGAFDVMYCSGVSNTKNLVEKENIKVGKSIVVTKQETQKQIIQNTGLGVSSAQLYNLINSPLVYKIEGLNLQEYELETSEFGGYNGVTFGNRNIELVLNLPYKQERITNKRITFFD